MQCYFIGENVYFSLLRAITYKYFLDSGWASCLQTRLFAGILPGLILYRSCACCHGLCSPLCVSPSVSGEHCLLESINHTALGIFLSFDKA